MTSGRVSRDTVFKEIRPGAGFETGDFVEEKLGGLPWNDSHDSTPRDNNDISYYIDLTGCAVVWRRVVSNVPRVIRTMRGSSEIAKGCDNEGLR